eukprot:573615-Karenia_brevis.AAC.1
MRLHQILFTPTGTKNGPSLNDLEKFRVADVQFFGGREEETIHDQWSNHEGQHRILEKMGRLHHFQVQSSSRKPAKAEVVAPPLKPDVSEGYNICPSWFDERLGRNESDKENEGGIANQASEGGIADPAQA